MASENTVTRMVKIPVNLAMFRYSALNSASDSIRKPDECRSETERVLDVKRGLHRLHGRPIEENENDQELRRQKEGKAVATRKMDALGRLKRHDRLFCFCNRTGRACVALGWMGA